MINSTDPQEITGYIHAVSPIKKSGSTKYFNYTIQSESVTHNGVSFAVDKRPEMDTLAEQHSPVKVERFTISRKYQREDIVINKNTLITPTTVNFEYNNQHSTCNTSTIASISQVAPGQLVLLKGHLQHLSATKTIVLQSHPVKKQEGFINDPSGYIKLVLWGNHTDTLKEGCTYLFDKIRVKVINEEKYLNTPKNESECTISVVANFEEPIKPVQNISAAKDIIANIIGVTNINSYLSCCSCNKSITVKGEIALCNNCSMSMKISS